jgi:hypothetical protein
MLNSKNWGPQQIETNENVFSNCCFEQKTVLWAPNLPYENYFKNQQQI